MIIHLRRMWDWAKLLLLFIVFTLIGYMLIGLLADWLKPSYRFEEPVGKAVKVFSLDKNTHHLSETNDWERLKLFYRMGE